VSKFSQG